MMNMLAQFIDIAGIFFYFFPLFIGFFILWRYLFGSAVTKTIAGIVVLISLLYAALLTIGQYEMWAHNDATKIFTTIPLEISGTVPNELAPFLRLFHWPGGYFAIYSLYHFWLSFLLSLVSAALFVLILFVLNRFRPQLFEEGDLATGFLCAFLSGWPAIILFVPLSFTIAVSISAYRLAVYQQPSTSLRLPFLLGFFLIFVSGLFIDVFAVFHLSVLRI